MGKDSINGVTSQSIQACMFVRLQINRLVKDRSQLVWTTYVLKPASKQIKYSAVFNLISCVMKGENSLLQEKKKKRKYAMKLLFS